MDFKISLKKLLIYELAIMLVLLALFILFPSEKELLSICMMVFIFSISQLVMVVFKGGEFIIWNEPSDSWWKYYAFFSIFVASFLGNQVAEYLYVVYIA